MTDEQALKVVAHNVRRLRLERELSMAELARLADTYPSNIKRIEDRESMPGAGMLTRISEALGVTVNDLVSADGKLFSKSA